MQALDKVFKLGIKEATLEMNPDDVTPQYLADLKNAGITRASMGVQSFDEQLLSFMHRAHTRTEAITSLESLASAGFSSFSVDLIYGNPGQSPEGLALDLETLIQYHPPHVSAYSLTIEPRTRLGKQLELGRLIPAEDDHVAHQFDMVAETLEKHGILRYEVSNFAVRVIKRSIIRHIGRIKIIWGLVPQRTLFGGMILPVPLADGAIKPICRPIYRGHGTIHLTKKYFIYLYWLRNGYF